MYTREVAMVAHANDKPFGLSAKLFSNAVTGDSLNHWTSIYHSRVADEFESIILSTEAQRLALDMRDGCMVSKSGLGAPALVMQRQKLVPRTGGKVSERTINELVENDLVRISGDTGRNCKLTKKGEDYAQYLARK